MLTASPSPMAADLDAGPILRPKATEVISERAQSFLQDRDGEVVKIWVFFTDKGVFDKSGFERAAASVTLTERALRRRAKVGKDHVVFADLPVATSYVDQIVAMGGSHRRSSRWLNAASFDIPAAQLESLADLPFVAQVKPLVQYRKPEVIDEGDRGVIRNPSGTNDAFDYGLSQSQLQQIGVTALHTQGYSGEGVTLAIMDTGYRKTHQAFANHVASGRVLAEWDFVQNDGNTANESGDASSQWNHGTYIWSVSAGEDDGNIYGPAYKANIILCKTENVSSETQVEEDNWVAALEFSDSVGTDVITTSLGYSDFDNGFSYSFEDMDGQTATISIAASTCDGLGIVMCNSMGNSGPSSGSLTAPADAFDILSVGSVSSTGVIASSSSRGPTADGRIKPEVCARGVSTRCASPTSDVGYTYASGTSLSTPLVAGAVCLLIEARPDYTPSMIRETMKNTASQAATPDNTYGWGILDMEATLSWGASFAAANNQGDAPLTVEFAENSELTATEWLWYFGDGDSATIQAPTHVYELPGSYDVTLTVQTDLGEFSYTQPNLVRVKGDTLRIARDSVFAGQDIALSVNLFNTQYLEQIVVPFQFDPTSLGLVFDSVSLGSRTAYFENIRIIAFDPFNHRYTIEMSADMGGGSPPLVPGDGEIMRMHFGTDPTVLGGVATPVDTTAASSSMALLVSPDWSYEPISYGGEIATKQILRGDVDYSNDGWIDIGDLTYLIEYLFIQGPPAVTLQSADANADLSIDIGDLNRLIEYLFINGEAPPTP
ncbi:MAG: S8 family serine peptidase [candidate division Zixibacteria bacterium]|nr:S8 family serine peptidase [candidate division Zixibacteria bacterium]